MAAKKVELILGFTGLTRSGKDTAADFVAQKFGFAKIDNNKDILWPELLKRKRKITKMNSVKLGDELRAQYGMDIIAQKTVKLIQKRKWPKVIISGIRSSEDIPLFKKLAKRFYLIRIHASLKIRVKRMKQVRIKGETLSSRKELLQKDQIDLQKKGLRKTLALADYSIQNTGSLADLKQNLVQLVQKLETNTFKKK
ncbi:MAG: hypothetical protein Q7S92_01295 [Candidatus Diapherotrites archaeon]|nr:hypothetical protein [Candidatus Diapherotrites archaeon]